MIKIVLALVLTLCFMAPARPASAHVFVKDDSNSKGAILHIFSDDDPIAGQESVLYFDSQNALLNSDYSVSLTITDEAGNGKSVESKTDGSLTTSSFIFPSQGLYVIKYIVESQGESYTFNQSQRVTRGGDSLANTQKYAWAEMLLVGSVITFALLAVVGFNNRKDIIKHSKIG